MPNTNKLIIDHDEQYVPIVQTAYGEVKHTARFSLSEESVRSAERLNWLLDFIRRQGCSSSRRYNHGHPIGVSHRLAAQIVYLAYWENYPIQFQMMYVNEQIVVAVHFLKQPEMSCTLDAFNDANDPEIQDWWNFICQTIFEHEGIWRIELLVDDKIHRTLDHGNVRFADDKITYHH